jgi:hypothetical protein
MLRVQKKPLPYPTKDVGKQRAKAIEMAFVPSLYRHLPLLAKPRRELSQ